MKTKNKIFGLFIIFFITGGILFAGPDLISVNDLVKIMKDKNTIIVSARTPADYQQVHIPGAVNVHHIELYKDPAINGYLKATAELAKIFGSKGISESKTIVLYDAGSGKFSGRLYWILKYLGAPNVKILDGQMKAWRAGRKPVTRAPVSVKAVTFTPKVDISKLATTAQVKAASGGSGAVIVDVRAPEEFNGTDESDIRKGHIPGAVNLEFSNVLTEDSKFKSTDELQKLFKAKGITPEKGIILYCLTSVRAGIVYFALTDMLGYKNVKIYDDAFFDWQSDSANKVAK